MLIEINRLNLTNSQARDFSMIQPYLEYGNWVTSISLARILYMEGHYSKKEISRLSRILSNLYHNTNLLIRKEKRRMYFHLIHKKHLSTWAYKLNPDIIKEYEI